MGSDPLRVLGLMDHPRVVSTERLPKDAAGIGLAVVENPATGKPIAGVRLDDRAAYDRVVQRAVAAQRHWQRMPAPLRGEVVRLIGEALRQHKSDLGALVSLEVGKIRAEGGGEVQECIDIADFALGLSRTLGGSTLPSERPEHRMFEQWHPLGAIGVITAFNFPAAVWAWNAMVAAVCGDTIVWKPSLRAPLTALATTRIVQDVMRSQDVFKAGPGFEPADVFSLVMGIDSEVGEALIADPRLPLISATGSCRMGRRVAQVVGARLGRTLLELGGNNAVIITPDADMNLVVRAVLFGAVGTAGQRCTSTRRLICVGDAAQRFLPRLVEAYRSVRIGDPMHESVLMGPLISEHSVAQMVAAIERAVAEGCRVLVGGLAGVARFKDTPGHFVEPTIIKVPRGSIPAVTREETFAPILYVFDVDSLEQAIHVHNDVPQGLSSAIFTDSVRAAERFLSTEGSDCGIANVNLGTSGAEIGGAFGGEKETGGGRESGSDSWKAYMRRQTSTINYGADLPLAQGIRFE